MILTRNEALDLPGCLESVAWSDDVHVLDSESTDRTCSIATANGAHVHTRPFDDFGKQRNFGLHELPYKYSWVLILDADERIPAGLAREMLSRVADDSETTSAYRIRRRDFLHGQWLKHVQASSYYVRLVRPAYCSYSPRKVNEVLEVDGLISDLAEPFDHFPFSKGIDHWFDKHNVYARMEAEEFLQNRWDSNKHSLWSAFFEKDFNRRRFHQKAVFYRLPFRPLAKFFILYFLKRGFLDGAPGLQYAQLQCTYERMIVLKTRDALLDKQRDSGRANA